MNRENQQVTSHQLAWLAGIWDGEGTFMVYDYQRKNESKKRTYTARVTLTNSSIEMINEISKIFDYYKIGGHIYQEKMRSNKHKACYHITVNKLDHVKKSTELMLPYLVNKKAHAEVMLRFVKLRENYKRIVIRDKKTGKITGGIKEQGYNNEEISLYEQLKKLNAFGPNEGTSQTIRQTSMSTCFR